MSSKPKIRFIVVDEDELDHCVYGFGVVDTHTTSKKMNGEETKLVWETKYCETSTQEKAKKIADLLNEGVRSLDYKFMREYQSKFNALIKYKHPKALTLARILFEDFIIRSGGERVLRSYHNVLTKFGESSI